MISVSEATELIQACHVNLESEKVDISLAVTRVLAENVLADRDFPPFHRVAMDGIALQAKAFKGGTRDFKIEGTQAAGSPPLQLNDPNTCLEVMTGAMLPVGADSVVPYEDITIENGIAHINIVQVDVMQNLHLRASDARANDILLNVGQKLSPAEIALLASVGMMGVEVFKLPPLAILSTGNELVGIHEQPLPYQIRRSNDAAINAALHELGYLANTFHLLDSKDELSTKLKDILDNHSLVILSGGVSKGKFDFIPSVMEELGIKKIFHGVSQRPGKPFWFGKSDRHVVFSLPGNPVSTYMCFYRYIKPWLYNLMGVSMPARKAVLAEQITFPPSLTYFLQVKVVNENGKCVAYPFSGGGSGDFANLVNVNGFLELPSHRTEFSVGEAFDFYPFRVD